ncbi:MAG: hypothetical protein IT459_15200 [Planctomycetes bacterium]|nr:hypothetical protein [Planctomycetota bacterium]
MASSSTHVPVEKIPGRLPPRAGVWVYSSALLLGLLIALPWLLFRLATQRRYREGLAERLTFRRPRRKTSGDLVWVHAASAGEMVAAAAWVAGLRGSRPDLELVLSSATSTGVEVARRLCPDLEAFVLPLDTGPCVARVLDRIRPRALVLVELELWPALLSACASRGIAIAVANGRVSPRTERRLGSRFLKRFVGLFAVDVFAVQNDEVRDRLVRMGVEADRVVVTGNLKIDRDAPPAGTRSRLRAELRLSDTQALVLAGSTHPREESLVARAFAVLRRDRPDARLVVAPRHRERLQDAESDLASQGFSTVRLSALREGIAVTRDAVVVVDTMGELAALYAAADVALVCGSFVPGIGGHNVFEPVLAGVAAITGPHFQNVKSDVEFLVGHGALRVAEPAELATALAHALADAGAMRRAAGEAARVSKGAVARTLVAFEHRRILPPAGRHAMTTHRS